MTGLGENKRPIVALLLLLVALLLFTGCKIEYPDALADDGSSVAAVSEVSAGENESSATVGESSAVSKDAGSSATSSPSSTTSKAGSSVLSEGKGSASSTAPSSSATSQNPQPVESQGSKADTTQKFTCTLSITCKTILQNMERFDQNKQSILPTDGVLYREKTVTFSAGESVFDVLLRETQNNRIHMEFISTPAYNSRYVEGIGNIYEFDCGEGSGWMCKVNGIFLSSGCSRYQLQNGDRIEWLYTCDLGRDIGGDFVAGRN